MFYASLAMYLVCILIVSIAEIEVWHKKGSHNFEGLTPIHLHRYTHLNWFECYMLWLFIGLISPIVFIGKIWWLVFHMKKIKDIL